MMDGAVFDVDGTLLDSMPAWEDAGQRYLAGLGIEAKPGLSKILYPMSMREGALYLKDTYGLQKSVQEIEGGINKTIQDFYQNEVQPKKGVMSFLERLRRENIPAAAATSSDRCLIEAAFDRLGLNKYFVHIFTCTEVGRGKDKPDIYLAAARRLGSDVSRTWVFEDALHAARTARLAGFHVAAVHDRSAEGDRKKLEETADIYIEDFDMIQVHAFTACTVRK